MRRKRRPDDDIAGLRIDDGKRAGTEADDDVACLGIDADVVGIPAKYD